MDADWAAVATAINTRMDELGMTQKLLAERSKVSPATIRKLQHNYPDTGGRHPRTLEAVSIALDWPARHLDAIAHGTAGTAAEQSSTLHRLEEQVTDLRARVAALEAERER